MRRAGAAPLALAVALAAGCGGGEETVAPARALAASAYGTPDPSAGRVLLRFVRAARRADSAATWSLLSPATRASSGGTLGRFRGDLGADFAKQFELLSREHVILSRRIGRFAVAAIAGLKPPDEGEEADDYAYGAALVRVASRWRLELGGLVLERLKPAPLDGTGDRRPEIAAHADASGRVGRMLVWLDGRPLPTARTAELPFTADVDARPARPLASGVHRVVVFAEGAGTATAVAWPFTVER